MAKMKAKAKAKTTDSRVKRVDVAIDHCDDYIDDPTAPIALRKFLAFARSPAHGLLQPGPHPLLFADLDGERVRVTMASRFGHVGITRRLDAEVGYDACVRVSELANFADFEDVA